MRRRVSTWASLIHNHELVCLEWSEFNSSANVCLQPTQFPLSFQAGSVSFTGSAQSLRPTRFSPWRLSEVLFKQLFTGKNWCSEEVSWAMTFVKCDNLPCDGFLTSLGKAVRKVSPRPQCLQFHILFLVVTVAIFKILHLEIWGWFVEKY